MCELDSKRISRRICAHPARPVPHAGCLFKRLTNVLLCNVQRHPACCKPVAELSTHDCRPNCDRCAACSAHTACACPMHAQRACPLIGTILQPRRASLAAAVLAAAAIIVLASLPAAADDVCAGVETVCRPFSSIYNTNRWCAALLTLLPLRCSCCAAAAALPPSSAKPTCAPPQPAGSWCCPFGRYIPFEGASLRVAPSPPPPSLASTQSCASTPPPACPRLTPTPPLGHPPGTITASSTIKFPVAFRHARCVGGRAGALKVLQLFSATLGPPVVH